MNLSEVIHSLGKVRDTHGELQVSIAFGLTEFLPVSAEFTPPGPLHNEISTSIETFNLPERVVIKVGQPCAC